MRMWFSGRKNLHSMSRKSCMSCCAYYTAVSTPLENWFGLFAPAGTPEPLLQKINAAVTQALKEPDLAKRLQDHAIEPAPCPTQSRPGAFRATAANA